MYWGKSIIFLAFVWTSASAVRLHTIFQFLDGYMSRHNIRGYLHIGEEYSVFLRQPKSHDRYLIYELYETRGLNDVVGKSKPRTIAISMIPVTYIKEQLKTFRQELYKAKYINPTVIPGTQVKTLKEWQIENALILRTGLSQEYKPAVLKTILK